MLYGRGELAPGVDRDMEQLVDHEVVLRSLSYDPEVVDERGGRLTVDQRAAEGLLGHSGPAVSIARGEADAPDALRLGVDLHLEPVAVDRDVEEVVEVSTQQHDLARATVRAGHEGFDLDREDHVRCRDVRRRAREAPRTERPFRNVRAGHQSNGEDCDEPDNSAHGYRLSTKF